MQIPVWMAGLEGIDATTMQIVDALGAVKWMYDVEGRVAKPVVRHTDFVPVAVNSHEGRVMEKTRFGMPGFKGRILTNARRESLQSAASWKALFGRPKNHCLTAVSYVVERTKDKKHTYRIQRKDGQLMVVPGLCAVRHLTFASTGNEYDDLCHVQVTAPANEFVATVHDRFICELTTDEAVEAWMAPDAESTGLLMELLQPADNQRYEMVPIAADVWTRRGDPDAVAPQGKTRTWADVGRQMTL